MVLPSQKYTKAEFFMNEPQFYVHSNASCLKSEFSKKIFYSSLFEGGYYRKLTEFRPNFQYTLKLYKALANECFDLKFGMGIFFVMGKPMVTSEFQRF